MPRLGASAQVSGEVFGNNPNGGKMFNFSDPAAWTMFFWLLSVLLIAIMFLSL